MSLMISLLKYEKLVFKPGIIHFSSCKKSILIDLIRRSINEIGHSKEAIAARSVCHTSGYIIENFSFCVARGEFVLKKINK